MIPWKVILATMVIFVCGVVTGALVVRTTQARRPPFQFVQSRPPGPGPGPGPIGDVVKELKEPLALTTNQCEKIVKIMQDSQTRVMAIRTNIAPLIAKEVQRAHQAISDEVLTPEQRPKYAELLLKEPKQRMEGMRGRGEGGFRGPRNTNGFPDEGRVGRGRWNQSNDLSTNPPPSNGP